MSFLEYMLSSTLIQLRQEFVSSLRGATPVLEQENELHQENGINTFASEFVLYDL